MEQQHSTSKVTVEYFDPHNVYRLIAPGLVGRLPLRNLHWQSHAGPLRSIDSLHVDLVEGGDAAADGSATATLRESESSSSRDDGFQTQHVSGQAGSSDAGDARTSGSIHLKAARAQRRHQIPGLRRTPYLKVLFVRCDDNDSYKSAVRTEIREWVKAHTPPSLSSKKASKQEKHDAFEWLIVHVVIPNTVAATQPRSGGKTDGGTSDKTSSSRWRTGSTPLMEKLRSDFNSSAKGSPDRIAQIRIGINDVPYDQLPRVVPAVPSGYSETEQDAENAWNDLVTKFKALILSSFDQRVTQYEEDIKEKDAQRSLPGWNFCTFFILKEGLARGFESVGLVEDALVGYDELSVGLDSVLHEQSALASPESHGGAMLPYTEELRSAARAALTAAAGDDGDAGSQNLQAADPSQDQSAIIVSSTKKAYRDMILANKVSVFDFRCYLFARQISLLLRLGNAWVTREELMVKLRDQHTSVLHGVAPLAPPASHSQDPENLSMLAEICRRTLEFIPTISQVMQQDIFSALAEQQSSASTATPPPHVDSVMAETVDNLVSSFAFAITQQILAQTSTSALPIPPSTLTPGDGHEPKLSIPEPKTMMHPARSSSLHGQLPGPPPSPGVFPGPGRRASVTDAEISFLKVGLEELAARRAELYMLSRSILGGLGMKRGWSDGWREAPMIGEPAGDDLEEVNLDDDAPTGNPMPIASPSDAGIESQILQTATDNTDDFYRLYEILTDKALRHFAVANHHHSVHSCTADLAILKFHLQDYQAAAKMFLDATPFFGGNGWTSLELSMLVMYCKCLSELESTDEYVTVALKLLTKSCAAERERLQGKSELRLRATKSAPLRVSPIQDVTRKILECAKGLKTDVKVPLANFFTNVELSEAPQYEQDKDTCFLSVSLYSLLPDKIAIDAAKIKVACIDGGPCRELVFETKGEVAFAPGQNSVMLYCNSVVPGSYRISHFSLQASRVNLHFDRDSQHSPPRTADVFKESDVRVFQRTGALDVCISAGKYICLDKNNSLELELHTGWNQLKSCEIRVRPATGGLRLLTTEARLVNPDLEFFKPPEAGAFFLGDIAKGATVALQFPYSVEQDLADVIAKVEVTYVIESGETFYLAKSVTVPVSLAVGVNVQDVFKHQALFSRFNVSTATPSPLRLYKTELLESALFESSFGVPPATAITIFPKQPACLMYKVTRKPGSKPGKRTDRVMHLKLHYRVLQTEVEDLIKVSVQNEFSDEPLQQYSRLVSSQVLSEVRRSLEDRDLERAALLGEVTTSFLDAVPWEARFRGLGVVPGTREDAATRLGSVLRAWRKRHSRISVPTTTPVELSTILIPVEVPTLSVVHTADMRLQETSVGPLGDITDGTAIVNVNQALPATLHLKWTRAWDTEAKKRADQEFSYEVGAPSDTWIIGGRRKGHFVIPAAPSSPSSTGFMASTADTEAEIPLVLMPQREGWLAYPSVEIREVVTDAASGQETTQVCEVDWRNLGETVRVLTERRSVTVSLDASGPGGALYTLAVVEMDAAPPMSVLLFNVAAGVAAVSAAHHVHRGFAELYPAWRTRLGTKPARAARTGWDYMMVTYSLTVLLNVKWARARGPNGWEECSALVALAVGGLREGWACVRAGEPLPLVAFWGVPALSVLGVLLA
ncbi:TMEM1 family protein [Purpureocillium lavendulum]|uniref:TMEM1 family protein n=1 Tax=Purpureocillium lavendulum TaxID=1247861 RepID=A0AB34G277_9HYPO|nr:TMEM1 family protein [Purpureocillium lavendulum]